MTSVFISSDHRGYAIQQRLVEQWQEILAAAPQSNTLRSPLAQPERFELVDLGPAEYNPTDDFNDAAIAVAEQVRATDSAFGILICGSAHGIAMQANRFTGIRAICGYTEELTRLGRQHNDANVLCLSADFMQDDTIDEVIRVFLATDFLAEERFIRRNQKLDTQGGAWH